MPEEIDGSMVGSNPEKVDDDMDDERICCDSGDEIADSDWRSGTSAFSNCIEELEAERVTFIDGRSGLGVVAEVCWLTAAELTVTPEATP